MTGIESSNVIKKLLNDLLKRTKDRESQAIIQKIQAHHLIMANDLLNTHGKLAEMEAEHAHTVTIIREGNRLETGQLNSRIEQLETQLIARQKDHLSQDSIAMLKFFFRFGRELSGKSIAAQFKMTEDKANSHIDELLKKRYIYQTRVGIPGQGGTTSAFFQIDTAGRTYILKSGLA
jgi:murein L,D-transpeptidase YcbB/YkuD